MTSTKPAWMPTVNSQDLDHILNQTSSLWDELSGQRVFISGGTGFFGHWIVESLLWANDILDLDVRIVLLSRNPDAFSNNYPQLAKHPAISWIQGDVKSFEYPDGKFSYVIHAASEGNIKLAQENPLQVFNTIVDGTHHILEFARTHKTKKLLFTSSGAVYGRQPPELTHVPENYIGAPEIMDQRSAYGEGKRAAELLCNLYSHQFGFQTKIARCFAFVGPHLPLNTNYAVGNFIRDALQGGPIRIMGDGTPYRSYLYSADLTAWLWTILFNGQSCRPYNVGSEQAVSIKELAEKVKEVIAPEAEIQVLQKEQPEEKKQRYVPSVERIKKELGVISWTSLEPGIRKTFEWIKFRSEN